LSKYHESDVDDNDNAKRRLLIDVSYTIKTDQGTGIQRVVKSIIKECYNQDNIECIAFLRIGDTIWEPLLWLKEIGVLKYNNTDKQLRQLHIKPGDVLLMLDALHQVCSYHLTSVAVLWTDDCILTSWHKTVTKKVSIV
jgi:hypothetical protein